MTNQRTINVHLIHYRCFQENSCANLSLEPGKTIALVGKNNAGKSSLMRFFYEMKNALVNFSSGSFRGSGGADPMVGDGENPNLGDRYGLGDLLELYPNRDSSKPVRFSISSVGMTCHFEMSKPNIHSAHELIKTRTIDVNLPDPNAEVIQILQNTLYLGAHRNLVNDGAGGGRYFDLSVGTAFTQDWDVLKNGFETEKASLALQAERLIANLIGWPSLSINASADKKQLFLTIDGTRRCGISDLGAGISELVLCIVTAAIKRPSWIFIDEPESHLHPAMQVKFVEALASLASHGIVFTTHSIGLARTCADSILVMDQDKYGRSSLRQFEAVNNFSQLMGELSFSQFHELGFNKLLLCEGVTEVKTLRQILRHWQLDSEVMIIPLGGTALIDAKRQDELCEFKRFGLDVFVIVDSEREEVDKPNRERDKFVAVCEALFGTSHVKQTGNRATENYFTAEAISKAMRSDKYRHLEPFQNSKDLKELFWGKNQNWRVAAEMSKGDWQKTDLAEILNLMASS